MKKVRKALSLFFALVIAASAVCAAEISAGAESNVGSKYVVYKNYTRSYEAGGREIYKGKARYPVLLAKSAAAKSLNKIFRAKAKKACDQMYEAAVNDYNMGVIREDCVYTVDMVTKLVYNENGKYSFREKSYIFSGGAHGCSSILGYTFNKRTGKKLPNSKLTRYDAKTLKSKIVYKVKKEIEKNPSRFFENALQTVKNRKLNKFNCWLRGSRLHVYFNQYDLSFYMGGPTEITIKL